MKKLIRIYLNKKYGCVFLARPPIGYSRNEIIKWGKILIYIIKYSIWLIDEQLWLRYKILDFHNIYEDRTDYPISENHESEVPPPMAKFTAISNDL